MDNMNSKVNKRGGLLTAYLIFFGFFGGIFGCFTYPLNQMVIKMGQPGVSNTMAIITTVISVATVAFSVGTWRMEKWGVYGFIACNVISIALSMIQNAKLWAVAVSILFTVLFIFLTRSVWGDGKVEQEEKIENGQ